MPDPALPHDPTPDPIHASSQAVLRPTFRFLAAGGLLTALIVAAATLPGCGSGSQPLGVVDPGAAPLHPAYGQVETILKRACAPCHKSAGGGIGGESENLDYSGCAGITSAGSIDGVRRSVFERGDMPPGAWPRLDQREQLILQRWISDGAKGPCTP